jgi:hypothetical protein
MEAEQAALSIQGTSKAEQGVEVDEAAILSFRDTTSNRAAPQLNFGVREPEASLV